MGGGEGYEPTIMSIDLRGEASNPALQRLLGHSTSRTTERYAGLSAIALFPDVERVDIGGRADPFKADITGSKPVGVSNSYLDRSHATALKCEAPQRVEPVGALLSCRSVTCHAAAVAVSRVMRPLYLTVPRSMSLRSILVPPVSNLRK